jgi:hypothetical protein
VAQEPEVERAEELPAGSPDVIGLFMQRQDNSLFIQSGETTLNIKRDAQGNVELGTYADGSQVEVVVTRETLMYQDVTFAQYNGGATSGSLPQVLKPGALDEVGEHSSIQVWGEKRGDRIVAQVIVYTFPAILQ